jgi:ABC-2 type transport system ATP-binding protein
VGVLGRAPGQSAEFLDSVGYLAQDVPLYKRLSAGDHLDIGARLNRHWDAGAARARLAALKIPLGRPVATLSGGQRAQVGLSLALAKRPQLLLLDEPVAALDPLARREFLTSLTTAVADGDLSVILSSHLLHDLERVCDHLILLAASRTQLVGDIDAVLANHRMLVGPRRRIAEVEPGLTVIKSTQTARQTRLLACLRGPVLDPSWDVTDVGLEDIVVAYMGREASVLGRTAAGQRVRGRHPRPGLDPGRHPRPLAEPHRRVGATRCRRVGRGPGRPRQLVAGARKRPGLPRRPVRPRDL